MERTGWLYRGVSVLLSTSTPLQYYDAKLQSNLTVQNLGLITANGVAAPSGGA